MRKKSRETDTASGHQEPVSAPDNTEQPTVKLGLRKPGMTRRPNLERPAPLEEEAGVVEDQETVHLEEDEDVEVVPAPRVRRVASGGARRSLRKMNFNEVRNQEPYVRGEYFIDFLNENLALIESMSYLDGFNFVTLVAHEFRFTHLQTLEILEKFQREHRIVSLFQVLIQLYETYVASRDASPVRQVRQMYTALVRLFESPVLRNEGARLEVLEITRKIFNLSRAQFFQMRSEFLN